MPHYDFDKDLPIAMASQKEVERIIVENYDGEILESNDTYRYDILAKLKGKIVKIEVKEDFTCEYTGNVGLEYECRGKLSGINTTEADFYIYKLHTNHGIEFVLQHTDNLRQMVNDKRYFRIVNGGDKGSNSMNYLFKYKEFMKTGRILTS